MQVVCSPALCFSKLASSSIHSRSINSISSNNSLKSMTIKSSISIIKHLFVSPPKRDGLPTIIAVEGLSGGSRWDFLTDLCCEWHTTHRNIPCGLVRNLHRHTTYGGSFFQRLEQLRNVADAMCGDHPAIIFLETDLALGAKTARQNKELSDFYTMTIPRRLKAQGFLMFKPIAQDVMDEVYRMNIHTKVLHENEYQESKQTTDAVQFITDKFFPDSYIH
jgi:hypothetical protein